MTPSALMNSWTWISPMMCSLQRFGFGTGDRRAAANSSQPARQHPGVAVGSAACGQLRRAGDDGEHPQRDEDVDRVEVDNVTENRRGGRGRGGLVEVCGRRRGVPRLLEHAEDLGDAADEEALLVDLDPHA